MTGFENSDEEHVSRRQAAERLVDVAHALTTGTAIELEVRGRRVTVPVAEIVVLECESDSSAQRVKLELRLTWLTPEQ